MTCPNCRGETHRYDRHLVCSAGCGWSQDEATPAAPRVEPRRPQVGDEVDVSWDSTLPLPAKVYEVGADNGSGEAYFRARSKEGPHARCVADEGTAWRWPATQGAAVAGPVCACPLPCVLPPGHEGLHRLAPPPPASEPPPGDMTLFLSQEVEAQRKGVQRERERADAATAAKAALEVQLAEAKAQSNEAHGLMVAAQELTHGAMDRWQSIRTERDNLAFNYGTLVTERDALAAQLAGVGRLLESIEAHAERTLGASTAEKDRALDWICGQAKGARAALAASGPVKEGE